MGICETFLDDNVEDNEICIEGYNIVKKNRNRHGGGVILYIKEGIQYTEITDLADSEVEVWRQTFSVTTTPCTRCYVQTRTTTIINSMSLLVPILYTKLKYYMACDN